MKNDDSARGPVLFYTEAVIDHFSNPRNVGELAQGETDGFARIGDIQDAATR
jgi:NifU-like protein involved in Fe-S cluster formation